MSLIHLVKIITAYKPTPFAKTVKLQTKANHDRIESHPFVRRLINGKITDLEYAAYLNNLLSVYATIESKLFDSSTNKEFFRSSLIMQDLNKYKAFLNVDLARYNFWEKWVNEIKSGDNFTVLANFYIRWLGDMYGGQIMAKNFKFNSMLKYSNVRKCIKEARALIEAGGAKDVDYFIECINRAYENNFQLATDLQIVFHENVK